MCFMTEAIYSRCIFFKHEKFRVAARHCQNNISCPGCLAVIGPNRLSMNTIKTTNANGERQR